MSTRNLPTILCVDDEPRVLEGLALHLRKEYDVHCATSGEEALRKIRELGKVCVIVSDMRMPKMDGATLLAQVMTHYPATTRILLTGEPGRDAAVSAVNKGHVFQFLTKPCAPDQLRSAVEAGVIQHRVMTAEREILQETVLGCINALIDVLALSSPVAFGRANRVKRLAMEFSAARGSKEFWQLEAAAMLSQIGYLSLPVELVEKAYYGAPLSAEEQASVANVPKVAIRLLDHIPRLEPVWQVMTALDFNDEQLTRLGPGTIGTAARTLGMVLEYDSLVTQGNSPSVAAATLRRRADRYGLELIEAFANHVGAGHGERAVREMPLRAVQPGMTIMQDLRTPMGILLVPRGFEVTATFMERIQNYGDELLSVQVKVLSPA
jgi:response regulator RpfG family c-di-GMP phosphodiesterase